MDFLSALSPAEQVARVMARLYDERLATPSGGNLSLLDDEGALWVTPRQIDKGRLEARHIARVAPDGTWTGEFPPTSEWRFHHAILRARPDQRAVVHAHPPSLVALAILHRPLAISGFPDLHRWVNHVDVAEYATPGSHELGKLMGCVFERGCDAALMENHGATSCGRTLLEAYHRMEAMEHLASIFLGAAGIGLLAPGDASAPMHTRDWTPMRPLPHPQEAVLRGELLAIVARARARGLLGSLAGAFSVRCGQGLLITPDAFDKAFLEPDHLVRVEDDRCEAGKLPDAMVNLHQAVYAAHPHVHALATVLPPKLMAFAASGVPFDTRAISEAFLLLGAVERLPFETRIQPAALADAFHAGSWMVLIENACAVFAGDSLFAVFDRLEVAERTATSLLAASALGTPNCLGSSALEALRKTYGFP